jgi:hypothetical protein
MFISDTKVVKNILKKDLDDTDVIEEKPFIHITGFSEVTLPALKESAKNKEKKNKSDFNGLPDGYTSKFPWGYLDDEGNTLVLNLSSKNIITIKVNDEIDLDYYNAVCCYVEQVYSNLSTIVPNYSVDWTGTLSTEIKIKAVDKKKSVK